MAVAELKVELREKAGRQISKTLRKEGKIPAVFYAHGEDSVLITLDEREFSRLIHTEVNVIDVAFPKGEPRKSIVREVQYDPVTDAIVHVDLLGIKLTEKIKISIPVLLTGTPAGVKEGGILEHPLREVMVEGLPLEIPEHVEVDVSELNIGDSIVLENLSVENIRFVTDLHHPVAHVIEPKVIEEEVPEELEEEGEEGAEGAAEETAEQEES